MEKQVVPMLQSYKTVALTNAFGESFDITSAVAELNIYEDLFSSFLTGDILYLDEHGGLSALRLTGNEKITVELYKSDENDETTSHDFFCYMVSDVERINDATSVYKLQFTSFEAEIDKNTKVFQAIRGSVSEAVNTLFNYLATDKKLTVEQTVGNYQFVMPSITPTEAINWYAGRSISAESNGSFFLFYETLKNGFNYNCIDTIVSTDSIAEYRYEPAGNTFLIKNVLNIKEYVVMQAINTLRGIDEQYTTLFNTDSIRKKIVKQRFVFDNDKKSTLNKDNDSLTASSNENGFNFELAVRRESYGGKIIVRNETRNTHSATENYYYDAIQPKLSAIRQYDGLKLRMSVFGNNDIEVGKVVNLTMMKTKMFDAETKDESIDEILSGRYLVTAVRYIYKLNEFDMAIEVVKDTKGE